MFNIFHSPLYRGMFLGIPFMSKPLQMQHLKSWLFSLILGLLSLGYQPEKRQIFLETKAKLKPEDLVYMDESGIDESTQRDYARLVRGNPVISEAKQRTSIISGWLHKAKEFIAPYIFKGYTDGTRFNQGLRPQWLEKCLIPKLRPGQAIIMDNASFHKGAKTRELIEAAGCHTVPTALFTRPESH